MPTGPLLCRLHVPSRSCLCGSITDRRDFYTQAKVSLERSLTNACGPAVPLAALLDTTAAQELLSRGRHDVVDPDLYAGVLDFPLDQTLPEGRPVLQQTSKNRAALLAAFVNWLCEAGFEERAVHEWPAEELSKALAKFGRELFEAGYPYWHLSETINALAAKRPAIRRQLQGAWDVAFAWMSLEPHTHHVAMPAIVLLAVLSVSLLWGWRTEAGPSSRLWPYSAQTLRRRLDTILEALLIPTARNEERPLDRSFRPGGATYLLQATEDAELVRRRGRWVSHKVMDFFLTLQRCSESERSESQDMRIARRSGGTLTL
ncbi:unnamed protein product [Symbiodinium sp. CCMP2592]|nr:unnamed protein product [Symbiodinium sp. CCMP2592]